MARVRRSARVGAPVERVFARARDPRHWSDWYVGLGEPEAVDGDGTCGTVVRQTCQVAGVRFPVTNRVVEEHIGPAGARWKEKIEGPTEGEQTIVFVPEGGETDVTIDLEYTVPLEVTGRFSDKAVFERLAGYATTQSLERLKRLCETE